MVIIILMEIVKMRIEKNGSGDSEDNDWWRW